MIALFQFPGPSGISCALVPEGRRQHFARLSRTASRLLGASEACVCAGDPAAPCVVAAAGANQVPHEVLAMVLALAAQAEGALLVPDARNDARFAGLPAMAARMVAVQPLNDDEGRRFGFLCAFARAPRAFSADDREALADLAALAAREGDGLGTVCPAAAVEAHDPAESPDEGHAVLSHEIRTPLFAIQSAVKLLNEGCCPPESPQGRRMMAIVSRNADHLIRISHDVLTLEALAAGALPMASVPCDGKERLEEVAASLSGLAEEAGVTLVVAAGPVEFEASRERIDQVLFNLVGNAIKFSPPGSCVTLEASRDADEVVLVVRDQGCGISAEDLARIFEPYHQVRPVAGKGGGIGLGLPISREIVRAHGGRLWAQSAPGEGSAFYVALPARTRLRLSETLPR